ncbi:RNA-directed DNA polymerase, eukaryota [Tanacetum coccineum]|uniref:RNA-directed DNA polymerase, eukaryota n=1 Tax=Tanacetum coccineum TaxID=301880 RepID=A0ABQ5BC48_9ASTR
MLALAKDHRGMKPNTPYPEDLNMPNLNLIGIDVGAPPLAVAKMGRKEIDWLENDQNCLVRHRWINGHWWWDWRRDVRGGSEYQQLQMLTQADSHVALREGQDRLWWDIDIEGMFSVGITRKFIDNQTLLGSNVATRWCSLLSRKVNILMWRARLNKLSTRYNLSRKGIKIASIMCPVCGVSMESLSHVLFTCTLANEVWKRVYNWCQVDVRDINDLGEWFDWCDRNFNVRDRKVKNRGHRCFDVLVPMEISKFSHFLFEEDAKKRLS